MVYRQHLVARDELEPKRVAFIKEILHVIMNDLPYCYFDEMALHSFMYHKKSWSYKDELVEVPINQGKRLKQSVYGVIGNIFRKPFFDYYFDASNGVDCLSFLKKLKNKATPNCKGQKLHIILDNAMAHGSVKYGTREFLA